MEASNNLYRYVLTKSRVEMPIEEMLEQNLCCLRMVQTLVQLREHPTTIEWVSLARDFLAIIEEETPIKIKGLGSFNIPVSINGVFLGEALCDLGANINLMSIATFRKIKG